MSKSASVETTVHVRDRGLGDRSTTLGDPADREPWVPSLAPSTDGTGRLEPLLYSTLELQRDFALTQLFSADLARAWVPVIHESAAAPEGLIWVSRRFDEEQALMLFGSRVDPAVLRPLASVEVTGHPDVLRTVYELARRADIDIIR